MDTGACHLAHGVQAADLGSAVDALRSRGLRLSAARRLVLEALYCTEEPVPAEQIAGGLDGRVPSSDLASVYLNLEMLEEVGLVKHFHLGHGPGLYARVGAQTHEYLVCDRCRATLPVDPADLDKARAAIKRQTGWLARFNHFPVAGLCPSCADDIKAAPTRRNRR